ncbi:MAG TPA: SIS domain-containing protein [Kofleriaceae bacterium]|nr:SIS domain-containing protein [Kofleriaceae bacterium]
MGIVRDALVDGMRARAELVAEHEAAITAAAELVRDAILAGHKVLLCGNGGSAADAQHIAAELVGRYVRERKPLAAIALTTDTSALTAIANDYGYDHVFARQVDALGAAGDVLIAITTSGGSPNVVAAVRAARARGLKVVGLTGARGAAFVASCDAGVAVPSTVTARIQELHIAIGHVICEVVDDAFAPVRAAAGNAAAASHKLYTLPELIAWREAARARGKTVVWSNGVFDVLHVGHLHSLREAKKFGDLLVVGVNGDASVRASKGPNRPIYPVTERVELLAALELVDALVVFDDATPERVLAQVRPDVHVKGADYANKPIPERAIVEAYGGRVELVPLVPGRSTTDTLARRGS